MAAPRAPAASSSRRPVAYTESEPDEVVGDFQRGKEIGKGSFAAVYLARHVRKKNYAAIKAVQMTKLTKKLKENLDSEISILKGIQHPHIVALFGMAETPSYIYLVMEYCQLSDLSQFMKKRHALANLEETADIFRRYPNPPSGGLNEVLSRHFLKQIASALEYLRGRNLIHRDIKPQNLLLNPAPSHMAKWRAEDMPLTASANSLVPAVGVETLPMLKIADFGFARHLPQATMAETLCGSPLYMAPEILRYEKYDARADLWSTGTVLHEMVVGKPPFRAQNHVELLRKIEKANDQIVFDNKTMVISRAMKDCIRKLLKKNPTERVSYEDFFADPVVTGDIPGLVPEDSRSMASRSEATVPAPEVTRRPSKRSVDPSPRNTPTPEVQAQPRRSLEDAQPRASRGNSEQDIPVRRIDDLARRKSSVGTTSQPEGIPIQRQSSQRQQRRPSIVAHATAPAREGLHIGQAPAVGAPRMERRASRTSPLAGPPMVREASAADRGNVKDARAVREARERTAQEVAFEKEYVVIEKRAVEVNAFADELDANAQMQGRAPPQQHGTMVRRATTQGQPTIVTGGTPGSPSRNVQVATGRTAALHQRAGSFERRYAPSPQSATNMLTKALNAANVRIFGALGTSPPFGKGASPPRGYGAFPTYPATQGTFLLNDAADSKTPMDEDTKIVRVMEEAATRSDVIFGFAEVKYKQLLPATPSTAGALGIQQLGAAEKGNDALEDDEDKDMTTAAIVGVAEEALVLYVKTLAILAKTIDLAGYWWNKQNRGESADTTSKSPTNLTDVSKRMNSVVQWTRSRFNECLEKSEVVGRRLQNAQRSLPAEHPAHPNNQTSTSSGVGSGGAITTSAEQIQITSGVTAEKLMFDRAVEMSRAAAVSELVNEELADCEIGYVTAIMLLEAVLENDDEPLMRKPSAKAEGKASEEAVSGMESEDRQTVVKLVEMARTRLSALRKKIYAAQQHQREQQQQQSAKRTSVSGNTTPKPPSNNLSPVTTPAVAGTPPR